MFYQFVVPLDHLSYFGQNGLQSFDCGWIIGKIAVPVFSLTIAGRRQQAAGSLKVHLSAWSGQDDVHFRSPFGNCRASYLVPACSLMRRMIVQFTCGGWIGHLPGEHPIAYGSGPQSGPIGAFREQRLTVGNDLLFQDFNAAPQIVLRLKDRLARILQRQPAVDLPIEVTAIALLVFVGQLQ